MKIKEFGVETWINEHETSCTCDLTNTCVGVMRFNELLALCDNPKNVIDEMLNLQLGYGKVFGTERLRNNIASLYENAKDANIVITHGAVGANALVMLSLIEKGDEVITYLPIYEQHYSIPSSIGANVKILYLKEENNWLPDLEELKSTITPKTKMICINNPNNPTGAVMDEDFLKQFVEIVKKAGAYILCDEVYRGLTHNGNPFTKSIFDLYEKGISTSSMSKTFSLPGLRLGWIVASKDVVDKVNIQRNYHVICVGRINDYLASLAIENKDTIVKHNLKICKTNLEMLDNWIKNQTRITYVKPNGGTTAFLKYNLPISSKNLCENFQHDTGIMILPGSVMDVDGYIRLGYTDDKDKIQNALNIFSDWLSKI
ncbi:MAG: aminotransferase [Clostridiaceae bacterium]|jgi:aspartate/methionine/tyrosine aminotransferase|nr:aminotransferase [Clostridiaceae bacterium]